MTSSPDMLERGYAPDLEVLRGGDGRTVCGIAVPYGVTMPQSDQFGRYDETIRRGTFRDAVSVPSKVKFLKNHRRDADPLGVATLLRDDAAGLYAELRVSNTPEGDHTLELIRDGAMEELSVGFKPKAFEGSFASGHIEHTRGKLREISAVIFGAYGQRAKILAVRSQSVDVDEAQLLPADHPASLAARRKLFVELRTGVPFVG